MLRQKFDKIFFYRKQGCRKGSSAACRRESDPCYIGTGGKSPCIVDSTAKIPLAARRIVFGKFLNCGQTCVAPDYILCDKRIRDELITAILAEIEKQFGKEPLKNPNYGKIINEKHFDRINSLIDPSKTVCGGGSNRETLQIEPTVLDNVTFEDPVMQQEIFGPVLPVLTYDSLGGAVTKINSMAHPLALYIFTEDEKKCPGSYFPMWFRRWLYQRYHHPSCHQRHAVRVVSAKAAWADITDRPDLMSLHITEVLWIRRRGWICRCGIRDIISLRGRCCGCF